MIMAVEHIKLLCDIGELSWIFSDSNSIETFLQKIVQMVAAHMNADVCSIYIYNEEDEQLVLTATQGLNPDSIGRVKLRLGEGLVGVALMESRSIRETHASENPAFKFFAGINEEKYEAFLAMPMAHGVSKIGVLVAQRRGENPFAEQDEMALRAVASQLANIIENAKLLMSIHELPKRPTQKHPSVDLSFVKGKVASEGYAFAPATIVDKERALALLFQTHFEKRYTVDDFAAAIELTRQQLDHLQKQVESKLSDVASLIFTAHLLILKDATFIGEMKKRIDGGENSPAAVINVARQYIDILAKSPNPLLREKTLDVQDLTIRLVNNILRREEKVGPYHGRVIIAEELFPSDLLAMSSEQVSGIVLVSGGVTSHLSILARSLQIPMVIANKRELLTVPEKTPVLVDAAAGNVYVNPSEQIVQAFQARETSRISVEEQKRRMKPVTATKDGTRIKLYANINLIADLKLASQWQAEGVGLYRTEFPFMIRADFPSEEEQFVVYRKVVEEMAGKVVTFRTLDMGGDKVLSYYPNSKEQNPFMGMRAIRFSLQNKVIFTQQIRAMLRAGVDADLHIMFPMIASLDEFVEARQVVLESMAALQYEGIPYNSRPRIGMMIEIPSVLDLIDDFAKAADFFSIGTNDLIQYMLAVDRTNETVSGLYQPYHPAVLRAMKKIIDSANRHEKEVSICGDAAHEEQYIPFLVGVGFRILSVEPLYLPKVQKAIMQLDIREAQKRTGAMLAMNKIDDVIQLLKKESPKPDELNEVFAFKG
jgi:phosphotransferase system enzyme I (PtsP)